MTGALERVIRRRTMRGDGEGCDLCNDPVPTRHRHVLDERVGEPRCVCLACALLFSREAAGRRHYRLVPEERLRLPDLGPGDLGVPVGLASSSSAVTGRSSPTTPARSAPLAGRSTRRSGGARVSAVPRWPTFSPACRHC